MKILFLTSWFPMEEKPFFGIFIKEHARAIQQAGANVKVVQIWRKDGGGLWDVQVNKKQVDGLEIHQIIIHSFIYKFIHYAWPLMQKVVNSYVRNELQPNFKPDIVHGNVLYPAGFIADGVANMLDVPLVLTEHWSKLATFFDRPIYGQKGRRILERAAGIYPVSDYLKQFIRRETRTKIKVIPNVVDESIFYYDSRNHSRNDRTELLCIMNFDHSTKHPELLFDALLKLPEQDRRNFNIRYIGRNQENHPLSNRILHSDIKDQVELDGVQSKQYIAERMRCADVLIHPSEIETFGVVVAEALQSGLPCMVSDIPALRDLVGKEAGNGWLIEGFDAARWSRHIKQLPNRLKQLDRSELARQNAHRFTLEKVGKSYVQQYNTIVNYHPR